MKCRRAAVPLWLAAAAMFGCAAAASMVPENLPALPARVVAVGIPGAGAVAPVGSFHRGGPIHDIPAFAATTAAGQVLDPERLFVTSTSNFGAGKAVAQWPSGSIISLDPRGETLVIPPDFGAAADQASALGGRAVVYSAQTPHFINGSYNQSAVTAELPAVATPTALSINNAFGRPWIAGAPLGGNGAGLESVTDPDGRPLAQAPSPVAGGVFFAARTDRSPQLIAGSLVAGAVGTALLGRSPDGEGRAVFAVIHADGSISQIHVEKGVDGLAPAGTIAPLSTATGLHAGVVFNWVPERVLYVADPKRNAIVVVTLADDGVVFRARTIASIAPSDGGRPALATPVDVAPAVPEIANPGFSSNTTLAGGSDYYVANRGNGSIARLRQDATVVAIRAIRLPDGSVLGANALAGIATSKDAARIYVTLDGPLPGYAGHDGAVLELPAFGAPGAAQPRSAAANAGGARDGDETSRRERGAALFAAGFTARMGLGPLFNGRSCAECHLDPTLGGMGPGGIGIGLRVGVLRGERFDNLDGRGGPVARMKALPDLPPSCDLAPGIPAGVNITSVRNAPQLYGIGLIDRIPDATLAAIAASEPPALRGRINWVAEAQNGHSAGRFGWKSETAFLRRQVANAMRNESGITNPLLPADIVSAEAYARCGGVRATPKDDGTWLDELTVYVASLAPLAPRATVASGRAVFDALDCAACHTPTIEAGGQALHLYSDLLLHDVGALLDDGMTQGGASGRDWRTTPLWGLSARKRFLHDGRATSIEAAIAAHGGQAAPVIERYRRLPSAARQALLAFLGAL